MKQIAIITGASGGIGREFVRQMYRYEIDEIWVTARDNSKLEQLRKDMGMKIIPIPADLSQNQGLEILEQRLKKETPVVRYLVNNAGMLEFGSGVDFSMEKIGKTIDLNCKAVVLLTSMCIPYMEKGSTIINTASSSAFQPVPYLNLYAATKAFVRSYSRALHVELKHAGITVTAVCPGWVDTPLLPKEINGKKIHYPGITMPETVVKKALKDVKRGRDMSVCTKKVKFQHMAAKLLPQRLVMWIWMHGIRKYEK